MRPTVTFQGHSDKPFSLHVQLQQLGAPPATAFVGLTRSDARALRLDLERAEQECIEHSTCEGGRHSFRQADAQPLGLNPGEVAVQCVHCPTEGVCTFSGDYLIAGEGS